MIYEFNGYKPVIDESAFVHPQATVTGNVIIGKDVYIGPGAAVRGDWGEIIIKDGCNVQENCTIHMFPGVTVTLHEGAHIGHGAIIHGATVGKNVLVGMNAVVMDNVIIGDNCIIGALCFVPADMQIPERKVAVGNPAKIVKDVSDEMIAWKTQGTALYQSLPKECYQSLKPCEPLRKIPENRPKQQNIYKTWNQNKSQSDLIYHLTTKTEWEKAKSNGKYIHPSIETEGFIHCSTADQLIDTANIYFDGEQEILVLCIDPSELKSELKYELAPKRKQEFPHIFGPINLEAVKKTIILKRNEINQYTITEKL
jgi:phenylacetic acid degradation protein